MLPLIPALALAFVSFLSSAFVILRIIVPILPPHPLSRRVRPVSLPFLTESLYTDFITFSLSLAFLTSALFPPQTRAMSGLLLLTSWPSYCSLGK